jgi:hypothetical protein
MYFIAIKNSSLIRCLCLLTLAKFQTSLNTGYIQINQHYDITGDIFESLRKSTANFPSNVVS